MEFHLIETKKTYARHWQSTQMDSIECDIHLCQEDFFLFIFPCFVESHMIARLELLFESTIVKRQPNGFPIWNYKYNNYFSIGADSICLHFYFFFLFFWNSKIYRKVNDLLIVYSTDAKKEWIKENDYGKTKTDSKSQRDEMLI